MFNENKDEKEDGVSTRDVLLKIRNNELDPKVLDRETRLACVEALIIEGQQPAAIAHFFKKTDRTIRRDLEEIRKGYRVKRDNGISNDIVSDFMFNSKVNIAHLMRLARSNEGSVADKVRAEAMAFRIHKEVLQELYYVGLLTFTQELAKINNDTTENPMTEKEKEMRMKLMPLQALEKHLLAEALLRREGGWAEKSWFSQADPNGDKILDGLMKKGILEEASSHEVCLKQSKDEPPIRPLEIAGEAFDVIWAVLTRPYKEEERPSVKTNKQENASEVK